MIEVFNTVWRLSKSILRYSLVLNDRSRGFLGHTIVDRPVVYSFWMRSVSIDGTRG